MANMAQAIRLALHYGEKHLGVTDIFGEDVGPPLGGVFTCTQGLKTSYNTPLDERGIIGNAIGIAQAGGIPVAEIQFADYIFNTIDLLKIAGNHCWASNGSFPLNLTVMTPCSGGIHGSIYHSHSFESMAAHLQGWKIVMPSNPYDAYGLLIACIKDPNPCLFLYPKAALRVKGKKKLPGEPEDEKELRAAIDMPLTGRENWKAKWPDMKDPEFVIGSIDQLSEGDQATIISYGRQVPIISKIIKDKSYKVDFFDVKSLIPWQKEEIIKSVKRTGKFLVISEDTEVVSYAEHIYRTIIEEAFYYLKAKPQILSAKNLPCGLNYNLEKYTLPNPDSIAKEIEDIISAQY